MTRNQRKGFMMLGLGALWGMAMVLIVLLAYALGELAEALLAPLFN